MCSILTEIVKCENLVLLYNNLSGRDVKEIKSW